MKRWTVFALILPAVMLPACGGAPPQATPTEIAVATLPPTTAPTPLPTDTPAPQPTEPPAVAAALEPTVTATATQTPTPTDTATPLPTNTPPPTDTPTPEPDWLAVSSRTPEGLMMLGNPNAPVTFIDFSDFM